MRLRATTARAAHRGSALLLVTALVAAGCSTGTGNSADSEKPQAAPAKGDPVAEETPEVAVSDNVARRDVAVDTKVEVNAENGTLQRVVVRGGPKGERGPVSGELSGDSAAWQADQLLEPGGTYKIKTVAVDDEGRVLRQTRKFKTDDLTLDEQTYPSIAPLEGETVGVGMPVIVTFDIPVTDRAAIERHLEVDAKPAVHGTWHWYSDQEVHFRPRHFYKPGSEVTVNVDINSIDAGNGVYGQMDRSVTFDVGKKVVSRIKVKKHLMNVFINDRHARTIPISAGMKGYATRSGTKIIMEKYRVKRMDAATTGVSRSDPEYYNIPDVYWAMRVTYSGEFIHGAPWSVADQGEANVSHGCVGMSLEDAHWLYERSSRGDPVFVTGTKRKIEPGNGYTDWDISYREYKQGSALS
jgi:lipoprotein-anchoring transpeptidase ErfK/SrfK